MFSLKQSVIAALALSIGMVNAFTGDGMRSCYSSFLRPYSQHLSATWYYPNGNFGACGAPMQNSDHIVALSSDQYAGGAHCWQHIGVNCMFNPSNFCTALIVYSYRQRQLR